MPIETQGTLPFIRKSKGRAVRVKECVVEADADFALNRAGFRFLDTTVKYPFFTVQCPRCRQFHKTRNTKGTGQDKGIPDRLVYSASWRHALLPAGVFLGIELKGSHTPFSCDEQRELYEGGQTVVARDGATAGGAAICVSMFFDYVADLETTSALLLAALGAKSPNWKKHAGELRALLAKGAPLGGDTDES